ncbi:NUDIX domain-containing protein [Sandarakinorhabdus sp.]|uniref:NUDIX domain-containing protein n=1 Tax=Sandarakinorhabdus sp. TaxID=1916663 RepID=UPI003F724AAA
MIEGWDGTDFSGAKLACLLDNQILVYRRDDKPGIPWPGLIDLPGGGREGDESPAQCALRELQEEFGLIIAERRIIWARSHPSMHPPGGVGWFLAVRITPADVAAIKFGDEGRDPQLLEIGAFLSAPDSITSLQQRLQLMLGIAPADRVSGYHTGKTSLFP